MGEVRYVYQHSATNTSVGTTYERPFGPFTRYGDFPAPGTYAITGVSLIFSEIRADSAMRHFYALINGVQCMNPQPTGLAASATGYNMAYGMYLDKDYTDFSSITLTGNKGSASTDGSIFSVRSGSTITISITYDIVTTPCTAPTAASLDAVLAEGNVNLNWSGAAPGVGNDIVGYNIWYREYDNAAAPGGDWVFHTFVSTSAGYGSLAVPPSGTRKRYRQYIIQTCGGAGASFYSGHTYTSNAVRRNDVPAAPGITAPVASKTIYNSQPRILATVGSDSDGHTQTLAAAGYAASSAGAQAAGKKLVLRRSSAAGAGAQSVSLTSTDALGAVSSATARSFTYVVPSWTDASLVAGETPIKAVHMTELRAAVDNVRAYYGLAAYPWAAAITAGVTSLAGWTGHVQELRTAIEQVVALVNGWDTASATNRITLPAWIAIPENKPAAAVITQLRNVIPLL